MTAPFSDENAKVRYVLIDGLKFEIKPEDRARTKGRTGGADAAAADRGPGERPGPAGRAGPAAGGRAAREPKRKTRRNRKRARNQRRPRSRTGRR